MRTVYHVTLVVMFSFAGIARAEAQSPCGGSPHGFPFYTAWSRRNSSSPSICQYAANSSKTVIGSSSPVHRSISAGQLRMIWIGGMFGFSARFRIRKRSPSVSGA